MTPLRALALALLLGSVAAGQSPCDPPPVPVPTPAPVVVPVPDPVSVQAVAKITAPSVFERGEPIMFQAASSVGVKFDWVISPAEQPFMVGDGRKQAITWSKGDTAFAVALTVTHTNGTTATAVQIVNPAVVMPPAPPPPGPGPQPPPGPTPDPVVTGKRALVIVRESADQSPELGRLITSLRAGTESKYLLEKGHTLDVMDDDELDAQWKAAIGDAKLPVILYVDQATNKVLHSEAPPAKASTVIETLRANGG